MKLITSTLCGIGIIALQACSAAPQEEGQDLASSENAVAPSATLKIQQDWGTGVNAHAFATNPLSVTAKTWQIVVDLKGGSITGGPWGAIANKTSGIVTFTPTGPTVAVAAGTNAELLSFNSSTTVGGPRPVIKAYNFVLDTFKTCETNSGKNPTKAALAVVMADELGRWEPDLDLWTDKTNPYAYRVRLSSSAVCLKNNCGRTKAILDQQDYTPDQAIFNNIDFASDLASSFERQQTTLSDLQRNQPTKVPISDYKLTMVAGPVNMGYGNCGPHYVFQVDYKSSGNPLSATDATNLMATMCFYGGYGCGGGNPYLGYITTGITGCPSGKQCIAIDPTDGDVSSTSTTTAGSAPSYPMNRASCLQDTAKAWNDTTGWTCGLYGSDCITASGLYGKMLMKASATNYTNMLYCLAQ